MEVHRFTNWKKKSFLTIIIENWVYNMYVYEVLSYWASLFLILQKFKIVDIN